MKKTKETINELVRRAREKQEGSDKAFADLCAHYEGLVVSQVRRYFPKEKDQYEDLLQEGTLAFYDAVRTFDLKQSSVTFGLYAKICIRNRLISIKRKSDAKARRKAVSAAGEEYAARASTTGEKRATQKERVARLVSEYGGRLAPLEKAVFPLYLEGLSYKEIAASLGRDERSVGNAIYRMKRKLRK